MRKIEINISITIISQTKGDREERFEDSLSTGNLIQGTVRRLLHNWLAIKALNEYEGSGTSDFYSEHKRVKELILKKKVFGNKYLAS